jgi:membrane protein
LDVLWRAWAEVSEANLFLVAGGVTYAILLALLFPALAALVSIYGLVLDPAQVERQVSALSGVLPEQSRQLLADELQSGERPWLRDLRRAGISKRTATSSIRLGTS